MDFLIIISDSITRVPSAGRTYPPLYFGRGTRGPLVGSLEKSLAGGSVSMEITVTDIAEDPKSNIMTGRRFNDGVVSAGGGVTG